MGHFCVPVTEFFILFYNRRTQFIIIFFYQKCTANKSVDLLFNTFFLINRRFLVKRFL